MTRVCLTLMSNYYDCFFLLSDSEEQLSNEAFLLLCKFIKFVLQSNGAGMKKISGLLEPFIFSSSSDAAGTTATTCLCCAKEASNKEFVAALECLTTHFPVLGAREQMVQSIFNEVGDAREFLKICFGPMAMYAWEFFRNQLRRASDGPVPRQAIVLPSLHAAESFAVSLIFFVRTDALFHACISPLVCPC